MFGETIFYKVQRPVTLNLKQRSGLNLNTRYYARSAYLQVLKKSELKWPKNTWGNFRSSRAANSIVSGGIRSKFKLIQALIHVLVTYKNEEDQIKNEAARVATTFLPLLVLRLKGS